MPEGYAKKGGAKFWKVHEYKIIFSVVQITILKVKDNLFLLNYTVKIKTAINYSINETRNTLIYADLVVAVRLALVPLKYLDNAIMIMKLKFNERY